MFGLLAPFQSDPFSSAAYALHAVFFSLLLNLPLWLSPPHQAASLSFPQLVGLPLPIQSVDFPSPIGPLLPLLPFPFRLGILQSLFADRSDQSCCSGYLCFVGLVVVAGLFKDASSGGLVYAQGCVRGGGLACAIGGLVCARGVGLGFAVVVWLVPNCLLDWSWVLGARCMELVVLHLSQPESTWTCRVCSQLCPVWVACSLVVV